MKLSEMKVDAAAVEQGEWIGDIPEMGDLRLKVKGVPNKAFRNLQAKLIQALPRGKRVGGQVDADEMDRITGICLQETVLLDWSGVEDEDGSAVPYSKEKAGALLTDPQFSRFRVAVQWAASIVGDGAAEEQAADEKNSPSPSAGA
ncbi:MAG: hypothetical protein ACTHJ3_07695 [Pararhizobium sp.]